MPRINKTQFAAHLGVTKGRVTALIKKGRVTFDDDGLVDLDKAIAAFIKVGKNLGVIS